MRLRIIFILCILSFSSWAYAGSSDTLLYKIRPASSKDHPLLLILLHGYGSNEDDLIELAPSLPANYTIVSLRAPITLQAGAYQWYASTRVNGQPDGNAEDLAKSRALIYQTTQRLQQQLHIAAARTIIAGFSQGAIMSYQVGLSYPKLCAGIGVFSGTLFESQKAVISKGSAGSAGGSPGIFIGHGSADQRIAYAAAEGSHQWLEGRHFKTEFHRYPGMGHSISQEEVRDFVQFVSRSVGAVN